MFTMDARRPVRCWWQFNSADDAGTYYHDYGAGTKTSVYSLQTCESDSGFTELTPADLPESHRQKPAPLPPGSVIPPDPYGSWPRWFAREINIYQSHSGPRKQPGARYYEVRRGMSGDFATYERTPEGADAGVFRDIFRDIATGHYVEITNPHPEQEPEAKAGTARVTLMDCMKAGGAVFDYALETPAGKLSTEGFARVIAESLVVMPEGE